ncbi:hypothetical protein NPX13_g4043 [Xylaria arbuscula]|uniref:Uncharacterized protein n=1 Tax=Xylaria arbuscula TaxID=114810 RepID=A0A9W8NHK3_9PEZI|nr:hypothetical protein NPX13_g4043 [Xylaria arbuscula]
MSHNPSLYATPDMFGENDVKHEEQSDLPTARETSNISYMNDLNPLEAAILSSEARRRSLRRASRLVPNRTYSSESLSSDSGQANISTKRSPRTNTRSRLFGTSGISYGDVIVTPPAPGRKVFVPCHDRKRVKEELERLTAIDDAQKSQLAQDNARERATRTPEDWAWLPETQSPPFEDNWLTTPRTDRSQWSGRHIEGPLERDWAQSEPRALPSPPPPPLYLSTRPLPSMPEKGLKPKLSLQIPKSRRGNTTPIELRPRVKGVKDPKPSLQQIQDEEDEEAEGSEGWRKSNKLAKRKNDEQEELEVGRKKKKKVEEDDEEEEAQYETLSGRPVYLAAPENFDEDEGDDNYDPPSCCLDKEDYRERKARWPEKWPE